nr:oligosaccharide flippase family protein [Alkalinema sp. FACHB-956]
MIHAKIRWILQGKDGASTIAQTFLARFIFMALTIVTGMITARYLGPEGRGELAAMSLWPQLLAFMATLGLTNSLIYNFKRYPEQKSELFGTALILGSLLGTAASIVGFFCIPVWLAKSPEIVIQVARWFVLTAVLDMLHGIACAALEAEEQFGFANQIRYITSPLLSLITLWILIQFNIINPVNFIIAGIIPKVILVLWVLVHACRQIQPKFIRLSASFRNLFRYGLRSYGLDLLGTLASKIDQIFIVGVLAAYEVGIYNAALNLASVIAMLQISAGSILFPKASARPVNEVVEMTAKTARVTLVLTIVGGATVVLLGPQVLELLYGNEFVAAAPIFRLLVGYTILLGTTQILMQPFMALDRPEMATLLQALGLGLNVVMFVLWVPTYGVYGVVYALLISGVFRLVAVMVSYPIVLKSRSPNLIPGRADFVRIYHLVMTGTSS